MTGEHRDIWINIESEMGDGFPHGSRDLIDRFLESPLGSAFHNRLAYLRWQVRTRQNGHGPTEGSYHTDEADANHLTRFTLARHLSRKSQSSQDNKG